MNALDLGSDKKLGYYVIDPWRISNYPQKSNKQLAQIEEFITVGGMIWEGGLDCDSYQIWKGHKIFTENMIRAEHGLNPRSRY